MIKAIGRTTGGQAVLIMGLDRDDAERLMSGSAFTLSLAEVDPTFPDLAVLVVGGETAEEVVDDIKAMGPVVDARGL